MAKREICPSAETKRFDVLLAMALRPLPCVMGCSARAGIEGGEHILQAFRRHVCRLAALGRTFLRGSRSWPALEASPFKGPVDSIRGTPRLGANALDSGEKKLCVLYRHGNIQAVIDP